MAWEQAGQQRPHHRTAVGGDEPEGHVRIREVGLLLDEHDVAHGREAAAETDGGPVHRGHDRDADGGHPADDRRRLVHDEGAQRGVGRHPLEEMEVAPTAEGPARAGDDDGACVAVGRQLRPDGRELAVQRLVGGIEGLGPVEGHEPHRAVLLDGEVLVRRHRLPRFGSLGAGPRPLAS